jgi:hypothetical protein
MNRFDGTAARQLDLLDNPTLPGRPEKAKTTRPGLKLLQRDVYAELARRRRRAQIAARHHLDR